MDNTVNNSKKPVITQEHKILFKNTFYSYLNNYGSYIFSLVTSFILARLISQDLWGYLILSLSYITIIGVIMSFLPPGLNHSLLYYLSRYRALKEKSKIKSTIKNAIIVKLLFLLPVFIISIIFFYYFSTLLEINLDKYTNLLIILSPLIIVNALNPILHSINQAFDRFRLLFLLLVLRYSINIGSLIYVIIHNNFVKIETIAFIDLFSFLIPFIVNYFLIMIYYGKMEKSTEEKLTIKESLSQSISYGSYITFGAVVNQFWNELSVQSIGIFESPVWVTGYKIGNNYNSIPKFSLTSFTNPLTISFSRLHSTQNLESINKIFILTFHYTMFFFALFTGIFYFLIDFFLSFIYGDSYLLYSVILKLIVIATIFTVLSPQLNSLIQGTKRVKLIPILRTINMSIRIPLFFIGLIYFGIIGAIISSLIFYIIALIISIFVTHKIFEIQIHVKKMIHQYLTFFLSFGLIIFFEFLFLNKLHLFIIENLPFLSLFKHINFLSLFCFVIVYLFLNLWFRIFSSKDIENLLKLFEGKKKTNKIIVKSLNLIKRFIRKS